MVHLNRKLSMIFLTTSLLLAMMTLLSCALPPSNTADASRSVDVQERSWETLDEEPSAITASSSEEPTAATSSIETLSSASTSSNEAPSADAGSNDEELAPMAPLAYPTGWLIAPMNDIPAGIPVSIIDLPGLSIAAHRNGEEVGPNNPSLGADGHSEVAVDGEAVVLFEGMVSHVPADYLLVNMPDILPQAVYDVVYSYASTSRCAGEAIPGVTGEQLPGYVAGLQQDSYLNAPQFVVPCAYRTVEKAAWACEKLSERGYRLLVFDAYRPMTAQIFLSDSFMAAYQSNPAMQAGLGWPLTWYVANGPSGHNFGTDLDVGVCDAEGNPLAMPSEFDAFDESGHLTSYQMNAADITPAAYQPQVATNEACLALHEAFCSVGFSELASEWWHFGDGETEAFMWSIVGPGGLDFVASL